MSVFDDAENAYEQDEHCSVNLRRAVDLIEGDDTVEAVAAPVEQLLQPPRGGEQRVGDDEDALLELDARVRLPARL